MSKSVFEYLVECGVEEICVYLVRKKGYSEKQALSAVYSSEFYKRLQNRKSGLFGESRSSLIRMYEQGWRV